MKKITEKKKLILYGCAGIGVNMLNLIVASYLCSALLTGGFEKDIENWTYLNKNLVIAGLWGILVFAAKVIDGVIDIPLSHFTDNLNTKWGKRKSAIAIGFIPMAAAYLLFLVPLSGSAGILNTIWFAALLIVFYCCYTLTMLTYYATFAEIVERKEDLVLISNVKSICDVVYFILGYALIPVFVGMGLNIRIVALVFLPLSLSMLIPIFLLKETPDEPSAEKAEKPKKATLIDSIAFSFKSKEFIIWLFVIAVMNFGLQLFLSGINEYFSTTGLNMSFVMASCFAPVPFTIFLYNRVVKRYGLGVAYRYILFVFSAGMALMFLCNYVPRSFLLPFAIMCGLITSFSIGAFFSVSYTVPSHIAATRSGENASASSMFFAIQGLFEGISAGLASGIALVYLKENGYISWMTVIVAAFCMAAFGLSFLLPKSITGIGRAATGKE